MGSVISVIISHTWFVNRRQLQITGELTKIWGTNIYLCRCSLLYLNWGRVYDATTTTCLHRVFAQLQLPSPKGLLSCSLPSGRFPAPWTPVAWAAALRACRGIIRDMIMLAWRFDAGLLWFPGHKSSSSNERGKWFASSELTHTGICNSSLRIQAHSNICQPRLVILQS